ncbi:MAG: substrate-binding domain-containing protein, partial [Thermomicrobiales bacterium]|nr:substrate-binding domain-containing protein [Thermomicrobiales bacterium]
ATMHLLARGHLRIAHIAGPAHVSSAQGRLRGYRRAIEEYGEPFELGIVRHAPFTIAGGFEAAMALLDRPARPRALFASNDLQAVGVMMACRELGIRIPDELALAGGDDIELAQFLEVPLTTFHQPAREIGSLGAKILLDRLNGGEGDAERMMLTPDLIVRASSGRRR